MFCYNFVSKFNSHLDQPSLLLYLAEPLIKKFYIFFLAKGLRIKSN
ncbi:hypothetical protein MtrunA17_Chr4g0073571 [Medicago truncatula]|uniref:Uncharacterized protein n=1 Tax=Medicago truncatula TaxID=3880 RepID=A0A396IH12_MEDTR|nr:hypothetical protein MtrunA17_Chr4g0073571 [Medicago truncatula]